MNEMNSETIREVCEYMKECPRVGTARFIHVHEMLHGFAEHIISAYEREMAAKDAEIARLKECHCEYALPNHGCLAENKHFHKKVELEHKVALLDRALRPVMECKKLGVMKKVTVNESFTGDVKMSADKFRAFAEHYNAVREAQRVMREFHNGESHN